MASIEKVVESAVVNAAKTVESQLDAELDRLANLQDDDYETIRRNRLAQLKKEAEDKAVWLRNGHGTLQHISEKDFFPRAKTAQRMVVVLSRPGTSRFASDFQQHLSRVSERHLETLFASLDAEKAPFLCDKFAIRVLPSLIFVKDGEIERVMRGLDEISSTGKFTTVGLERKLHELGMVRDTCIADDV